MGTRIAMRTDLEIPCYNAGTQVAGIIKKKLMMEKVTVLACLFYVKICCVSTNQVPLNQNFCHH